MLCMFLVVTIIFWKTIFCGGKQSTLWQKVTREIHKESALCWNDSKVENLGWSAGEVSRNWENWVSRDERRKVEEEGEGDGLQGQRVCWRSEESRQVTDGAAATFRSRAILRDSEIIWEIISQSLRAEVGMAVVMQKLTDRALPGTTSIYLSESFVPPPFSFISSHPKTFLGSNWLCFI